MFQRLIREILKRVSETYFERVLRTQRKIHEKKNRGAVKLLEI
jgi:hypothetical protein